MMFKPPTIEPGVKYPTVLFLYGGPHVQVHPYKWPWVVETPSLPTEANLTEKKSHFVLQTALSCGAVQ